MEILFKRHATDHDMIEMFNGGEDWLIAVVDRKFLIGIERREVEKRLDAGEVVAFNMYLKREIK